MTALTGFTRRFHVSVSPARPQEARDQHRQASTFHAGDLSGGSLDDLGLYRGQPDWAARFAGRWSPGEAGAQEKLVHFLDQAVGDYAEARNLPGVAGTSRLSPHLHFGEISPLQCWSATQHADRHCPAKHRPGQPGV